LLFLRYRITLCPNMETLSLHKIIALATWVPVIALYCYRYSKIGSVTAS
jgi:hypothetical protein